MTDHTETKWRVIMTDSEMPSGVAPLCPNAAAEPHDDMDVFDCCPGPHIECWSPSSAKTVLQALNETGAEVCS